MAIPNYKAWGLAEGKVSHPTRLCVLEVATKQAMLRKIEHLADLSHFKLAEAHLVGYYQGEGFNIPAGFLRFTRDGNFNLGGEQLSFIFERDSLKLLGMTQMKQQFATDKLISPQAALTSMIQFLQKEASDLMPEKVTIPVIGQTLSGEKIDFKSAPLKIGKVELQWVGDHPETFATEGKTFEVHGLKVKMYLPKTELWAWGIIGADGTVISFERDICWNFSKFQRETQMWLHDRWLIAQGIKSP